MDIYVERQCVEQIKSGDSKQFLLLFDANFGDLYKYVARRVFESEERENIMRLTFLDALGQVKSMPTDSNFFVWLCSLAKPRVWEYMNKSSFPEKQGLISASEETVDSENEGLEKVKKMMNKLSLEEREILRLKFFEEFTDGDVMTILGMQEGVIGPKIYRVLKRAHFLLFGESDERQGVYFGELSGVLSKMRNLENVILPEALKLSLRADISARIDRKEFAIEGEPLSEESQKATSPFEVKSDVEAPKGSDDPAKIFVEAVKEMKEEAREKAEKMEFWHDFFDRWKAALVFVPITIFVITIGAVLFNMDWPIKRGYPSTCEIAIDYNGDFSDGVKRSVATGVSSRLCDYFDVESLSIDLIEDGVVEVELDLMDRFLEYRFVRKSNHWRIKKYARTFNSNGQSREV